MAFYRICPDCGAYLDPGEQCSCHEEHLIEMERKEKSSSFYDLMGFYLESLLLYFDADDKLKDKGRISKCQACSIRKSGSERAGSMQFRIKSIRSLHLRAEREAMETTTPVAELK